MRRFRSRAPKPLATDFAVEKQSARDKIERGIRQAVAQVRHSCLKFDVPELGIELAEQRAGALPVRRPQARRMPGRL
jgi:hypothetical protein